MNDSSLQEASMYLDDFYKVLEDFKEDLGMNDIYKAVKIFYDFFNDDIDYDNDRLNAIKGYIIQDEDVKNRLYRTLTVCLVNLMAGANDNKFHELLEDIERRESSMASCIRSRIRDEHHSVHWRSLRCRWRR